MIPTDGEIDEVFTVSVTTADVVLMVPLQLVRLQRYRGLPGDAIPAMFNVAVVALV